MGQKVHPKGLRIGIIKDWDGKWFSKKNYADNIYQDFQIRKYLIDQLKHAGISTIEIERIADRVRISIHCARPGIVIGRKGSEVENLKKKLQKFIKGDLQIKIIEIKSPELDAQLVSGGIAEQLVRKGSTKRAMKQAANRSMRTGAKGIKISCSGRIGGAEIARTEWHLEGRLPLHTLRADIDYGFSEADTTYGKIGVTVWIFKGEILPSKKKNPVNNEQIPDKKMAVNVRKNKVTHAGEEVQKDVAAN